MTWILAALMWAVFAVLAGAVVFLRWRTRRMIRRAVDEAVERPESCGEAE